MSAIAFSIANELCDTKQEIRNAIARIGARNYKFSKDKASRPSIVSLPGNAWLTEAAFAKELLLIGEKSPFIVAIDKATKPKPISNGFSPVRYHNVQQFAGAKKACFLERSVKSDTAELRDGTNGNLLGEIPYSNFKSDFFVYQAENDAASNHSLYYFDSCGGPLAGLNSVKMENVADIDCLIILITETAKLRPNRTTTFAATFRLNGRNKGGKIGLLKFLKTPMPPFGPSWFKNTQGNWAIKHEVVAQAIADYVNREVAKQTKIPLRLEFQTIYKNGTRSIMGTFCWTLNPVKSEESPKIPLTTAPAVCYSRPVPETQPTTESIHMKNLPKSKPRSMESQLAIVKSIRSAATRICLENGVDDETVIKGLTTSAAREIKKMQIAGVKASLTKGQKVG